MVAGLLALMWADGAAQHAGMMPGLLLMVGLLVPVVWLASRELEVVLHAVGYGVPRGALLIGGLGGLLVAMHAAGMMAPEAAGGVAASATDPVAGSVASGAATTTTTTTTVTPPTDLAPQIHPAMPFVLAFLPLGLVPVLLGWGVLAWLRQRRSARQAVSLVAGLSIGFVFLGLLGGSWLWVRALTSPWVLAGSVLTIKSCDIGAYFTGRFIGRHKLILWLSPGKTWEGLVGGMAVSAGMAVALAAWAGGLGVRPVLPWWYAAAAGAILGYTGQLGDLFASALKRDAGVKDFAASIPGFGGVMDVADSVLLAGPVVLTLLAVGWLFAG